MKKTLLTAMALGATFFNANAQFVTTGTPTTTTTYTQGKVGIGYSTSGVDANSQLSLSTTGSLTNALRINTGAFSMNGTSPFAIDAPGIAAGRFSLLSNGRFGINNPTPTELLHIKGGDILVEETNETTKSSDGGCGADLYIKGKNGQILDIYTGCGQSFSGIAFGGTSNTEFRIAPSLNTLDIVNATTFFNDGKVSIGGLNNTTHLTRPAGYRLYVKDGILTENLTIALPGSTDWPDYVFNKNYKLTNLDTLKNYIDQNSHLPGIPSAQEIKTDGINVGKQNVILMEKIEELTLYLIELNNKIKVLEKSQETSTKIKED